MLVKELLLSYYKTQCLYVVSELDIADELSSGAKSSEELAQSKNINPDKLYRIMRFLASLGLFSESEDGLFSLTDESQELVTSSHGSLKSFIRLHATCFYQAADKMLDSLSVESSSFELSYGASAHHYFVEHAAMGDLYNVAMSENSKRFSELLIAAYPFKSYHKIIDVGGGDGTLLISILKDHPDATGVIFDLPSLQPRAEKAMAVDGVVDRCQFMGGSFFDHIPEGGDLYILKSIIHGKSDARALSILNNIKSSMLHHSKILIIDRIIDMECGYQQACVNDINMLNVTRGFDRTKPQFERLIQSCGLRLNETYYLSDAHFCLEITNQ